MQDERKVLVVDDDARMLLGLLRFLENRLEATFTLAGSVNEGLEHLHDGTKWSGLVADLYLPMGSLPKTLTSFQELSPSVYPLGGVLLMAVFQRKFPGWPTVVWSMAPPPDELGPFIEAGVCRFFHKTTGLDKLSELASYLAGKPKEPKVMREIWASLKLEPGFGGFGVDLKRLAEAFTHRAGDGSDSSSEK